MTGAPGSSGGNSTGDGKHSTEVTIVSVMAVKLPKLVNGETLDPINEVLKEVSCPS